MPLAQVSTETITALSDAGVGVLALFALIVLGFGAWKLGDRLFATVDRLAKSTERAQEDAETALKAAQTVQAALAREGEQLTVAMENNTREIHAQTAVLTGLGDRIDASASTTTAALVDRLDLHDAQAREGIARIEAALAALREEIRAGHNAQQVEIIRRLDLVLAELAKLTPPPPPPKIAPPPAPLAAPGKGSSEAAA